MTYEKSISGLCDLSNDEVLEFRWLVDRMRVKLDDESRKINKLGNAIDGKPVKLSEDYRELTLIVPILEKLQRKMK